MIDDRCRKLRQRHIIHPLPLWQQIFFFFCTGQFHTVRVEVILDSLDI